MQENKYTIEVSESELKLIGEFRYDKANRRKFLIGVGITSLITLIVILVLGAWLNSNFYILFLALLVPTFYIRYCSKKTKKAGELFLTQMKSNQ